PLVDLTTVRTLRRLLASACPRAVHAHGLRAGALSALALPRRAPVRLVVTLHNRTVGGPAVRAVGAVLLRILARRAETVLAVSPARAGGRRPRGSEARPARDHPGAARHRRACSARHCPALQSLGRRRHLRHPGHRPPGSPEGTREPAGRRRVASGGAAAA